MIGDREIERLAPIEIRAVNLDKGLLEVICAPYGETTFLAGDGKGERIRRGAFNKWAREQGANLKLLRYHDQERPVGRIEQLKVNHPDGLWAEFRLASGPRFDDVRDDLTQGLLTDVSVGMRVVQETRAKDGAREVTEAHVAEVSLVSVGAYQGARVLSMRGAGDYPHAPAALPIPEWMLG